MNGPLFNLIGLVVLFFVGAAWFKNLPGSEDPNLSDEQRRGAKVVLPVVFFGLAAIFAVIVVEWNAYAHTLGGFVK